MNTSNYETDGLNFITVSGSFYIFTLPGDVINHHLNDLKYQGVNNDTVCANSSYLLHIADISPLFRNVPPNLNIGTSKVTQGCLPPSYTGVPPNLHLGASQLTHGCLETFCFPNPCPTPLCPVPLPPPNLTWLSDLAWLVLHLVWNYLFVLHGKQTQFFKRKAGFKSKSYSKEYNSMSHQKWREHKKILMLVA